MKIEPLNRYSVPSYPTRSIVDERPELLAQLPSRWRANPVVLAALSGACMLISTSRVNAASHNPVSKVAPIFEHGTGRGSYGCMSVNPPVFLSEQEARKVIEEEAAKFGIKFRSDITTLEYISVPVTYYVPKPRLLKSRTTCVEDPKHPGTISMRLETMPSDETPPTTQVLPLLLDGTDQKREISYEYVSTDDIRDWHYKGNVEGEGSTVGYTDTLGAAATLREGLEKAKPKGHYAVFYDPMARPCANNSRTGKLVPYKPETSKVHNVDPIGTWAASGGFQRTDPKAELRAQVRDFIKWLKAEGVI